MTVALGTILSALVTILAVLVFTYMGFRVGAMRGKHNVVAPATSGHPEFERAFRVHYNTLEQMVGFLPLLWIATFFFRTFALLPALFGLVFVIGRVIYMQRYMADPAKRGAGTAISSIGSLGLLILSLIGLVQTWMAASAS